MNSWPWPAPTDDGGARHLIPGKRMPAIALAATRGKAVNLATLPGRSIVYIYTWTGRPGLANPPDWDVIPGAHGSTPEAAGFRDHHAAFAEFGCAVFGLSAQDPKHQAEFSTRLQLTFSLLSDESLAFADALSLPRFETGGSTYLKRLTLILREGQIEKVFYPVHPPDRHAGEVLDWLRRDRQTP